MDKIVKERINIKIILKKRPIIVLNATWWKRYNWKMIKHSSKTLKFDLLFISENLNEDPLQDVKKFKWGYKRKKPYLSHNVYHEH